MEETKIATRRKGLREKLNKNISAQEIIKFIKDNLLNFYIIINILYLLIGSFLVTANQIFFSEFANGYIVLFPLNIVVAVLLFITKKGKLKTTHIFMGLIVVFAVISYIFAKNQHAALYGFGDRWEGLLSIFYYISIMLISGFVENKGKKKIVCVILFSGVIQCICAIGQAFDIPFIPRTNHASATGCTQNPDFFGTYTLLILCYAIGLYIDEEKSTKKIIYVILMTLFTVGLLLSNTMSAVVGLIFVLIYISILCIKKKKVKKLIVVAILLVSTTLLVDRMGKTSLIKDFNKTIREASEVSTGNMQDNFGSGRMYIWKETIKIIPKYLLHGVGIDNFYYAFGDFPLTSYNGTGVYDKAHNEYLQILVTEGIFSLISYLGLYILIVKKGIKNNFKDGETYLIIPIIGYLIQAFFNISVIEVAPIFYIALGLCNNDN